MIGWVLLALLVLLLCLPVGAEVSYGPEGIRVRLVVGPLGVLLYPRPPKPDRRRGGGASGEQKTEQGDAPEHTGSVVDAVKQRYQTSRTAQGKGTWQDTLRRVEQTVPLIAETLGGLRRCICIRTLELEVIWAADNAADAALGFGRAHGVAGMLWPIFDHNFKVKSHRIHIDVDYQAREPVIRIRTAATIAVGQLLAIGCRCGWKVWKIWGANRRPKQHRRHSHERTESSHQ